MVLQAHTLGIIMGLIFAAGIGMPMFMVWHRPRAPKADTRSRRKAAAGCRLLVPIVEGIPSEQPMELAARLTPNRDAELVLVYVIVVPYELNLDAPLPEVDQAANESLDLAHAIAKEHGYPTRMYIVRQRNAAEGILQVARDERVDAIVLEMDADARVLAEWRKTSAEILRRSACEVIVDKVPVAARPIATAA